MSIAAESRTFAISTQRVTAIDAWIEQVAAHWSTSESALFKARLCVAELAANVLEHGRPDVGGDHMVVTIGPVDDGIEVEFLDTRAPFDPTAHAVAAKPSPSNVGGLGLTLIRAYADEWSYANDGTYNRIKLKIKGP